MIAQRRVPKDLNGVGGFNYRSAETIGHAEFCLQYIPSVMERDLDYAARLQLNLVRAFVPYAACDGEASANVSLAGDSGVAYTQQGIGAISLRSKGLDTYLPVRPRRSLPAFTLR